MGSLVRVQYRPHKNQNHLNGGSDFLLRSVPDIEPVSPRCETSTGQTKEASAQWAVRHRRKRPEFVSAKRAASPLQGRAATIERTEHWFESNCHHHESGRRSSSTLTGFFCVPLKGTHFSKSGVRTFLSEGYAKRVRSSPENCVPLEAFRSHPS